MKKSLLVCMSLLALAGTVSAQNAPVQGISESTDPAKIADVERRAQAIAQQGQNAGASGNAGAGADSEHMTGRSHHKAKKDRMHRRMHKPGASDGAAHPEAH